jgi:hypothetical protein
MKTKFRIEMREAVADNGRNVLNIDGGVPGGIYAYIDEGVQEEVAEQLAKRADTSGVIALDREGYAVDAVTFNTTLRELFTAETLPFDKDDEIDAWVLELESLAQHLRDVKTLHHVKAAGMICTNCPHSLLDHERPDSSDLKCRRRGCDCRGFFPIDTKTRN